MNTFLPSLFMRQSSTCHLWRDNINIIALSLSSLNPTRLTVTTLELGIIQSKRRLLCLERQEKVLRDLAALWGAESVTTQSGLTLVSNIAVRVQTTKLTLSAMRSTPMAIDYSTTVLLLPKLVSSSLGARAYGLCTESLDHRDMKIVNHFLRSFSKKQSLTGAAANTSTIPKSDTISPRDDYPTSTNFITGTTAPVPHTTIPLRSVSTTARSKVRCNADTHHNIRFSYRPTKPVK